jgi:hypothetical protein
MKIAQIARLAVSSISIARIAIYIAEIAKLAFSAINIARIAT